MEAYNSVCIISILRVIRQPGEFSSRPRETVGSITEFTTTWERTDLWTVIELNVAIVCACLPTLNPLWRIVTHRLGLCLPPRLRGSFGSDVYLDRAEKGHFGFPIGREELEGIGRGELEGEAVEPRHEMGGVIRQHGELDSTAIAELDGATRDGSHGVSVGREDRFRPGHALGLGVENSATETSLLKPAGIS